MIRFALLVSAVMLVGGCVMPSPLTLVDQGFNQKLRADRAALDAAQIATDPATLRYGPWRTRPEQISHFLRPDDPLAAVLPQSDCWYLANGSSVGRDRMLTQWEQIALLQSTAIEKDYFDTDGRLDVGLCRLTDPVTRQPFTARSGRTPYTELDCSALEISPYFNVSSQAGLLPRCVSDTRLHSTVLRARRVATPDGFARCAAQRGSLASAEPINASDFYDGSSVRYLDNGQLSELSHESCTADRRLSPDVPSAYTLQGVSFGEQSASTVVALEPLLVPIGQVNRTVRRLAREGNAMAWATPILFPPSGVTSSRRWEENYSSHVFVQQVRIVSVPGNVPDSSAVPMPAVVDIAATTAAPLCIEDPNSTTATGCRWRCSDTDPTDGRLSFQLDDRSCVDAQGTAQAPLVTPTYAIDTATAALTATGANASLRQPLRWRIGDTTLPQPWLEFTLGSRFATVQMRGSLTGSMPPTRVATTRRTQLQVLNSGVQTLRILSVGLAGHSQHPADFRIELPADPIPVPIGISVQHTAEGARWIPASVGSPADWFLIDENSSHDRLRIRQNLNITLNGQTLRRHNGLLLRDGASFPSGWLASLGALDPWQPVAMSYRLRSLPLTLRAGEDFDISVLATPGAVGDRSAWLQVLAQPLAGGANIEIRMPLAIRGLFGPWPNFLPSRLVLSTPARDQPVNRTFLISNDGDQPLTLLWPSITGPNGTNLGADASRIRLELPNGGSGILAPGSSREARVRFLGTCPQIGHTSVAAEVRWPTPDGIAVLPLTASTYCP